MVGSTPWTGPDTEFPDVVNADAAIAFLQEEHERPFFLMLGLWRPHTPFTAPRRFFDLYQESEIPMPPVGWRAGDLDDVPEAARDLASVWGERWQGTGEDHPEYWRRIVWGYLACTSFADWSIGRVIQAVDAGPYAENTLVIVTSDNGYHCGEKDHFEKSTMWEAAARVPLAIRLPDRRNAGSRSASTVTLVDLFPTLTDYCGLAGTPQSLEGLNLRPVLESPGAAWERPAFTVYEEHYFSARDARFRYIQYPDGTEELYDHRQDPHELHNQAAAEGFEGARRALRRWMPNVWAPSLGGRRG